MPRLLWPSLPAPVATPVSKGFSLIRSAVGNFTWAPALSLAKPAILSVFSRIQVGTLVLKDEPGQQNYMFGQQPAGKEKCQINVDVPARADAVPHATLVVRSDAFWMRLLLFADMGLAEAFMLGEVDCEDLTSFFKLFIWNRDELGNGTTWISAISSTVSGLARSTNTLSNALLNISAHYDISNDMFAAFLSPDMTYSCPIWKHTTTSASPEESLEEAQITKLRRFIVGAKIKETDHVLEIGTGWGSFAIEAVRETGCRITSLTLSREQQEFAERRIREAGFSDKIDVRLMDYRALPASDTIYDKIVSIEMLEAVGQEFLSTYFTCVDRVLKKDGGIAMFQCITMPEGRHKAYSRTEDFINHYIFPGGYLPSITQLLNHISQASRGTLIVENVENIGGHYAKTLRLWRENFLGNFESKVRPALLKEHDGLAVEEMAVFRRKWEYYFTYCEAGFVTKTLGDVIITVGREGAVELIEDIPT